MNASSDLIQRFEARLRGFNLRSLVLDDLLHECERRDIFVDLVPFQRIHGISFHDKGQPCLLVNSLLTDAEKIIAGYHELTHLLDQADDVSVFLSLGNLWNHSKAERHAQTVGVIALMPDAAVWGLTVDEISEQFQVSRKLAEFRLSLLF